MKLFTHYIEHQVKNETKIINWKNHTISEKLSYSYRDTVYDNQTFPSRLHYHDYYELVVFEEGNVQYVCEGNVYHLKYGDIILIPPGNFHMSVISGESTRYKRHVFYFYPSAFESIGCGELTSFLNRTTKGNTFAFSLPEMKQSFMTLLESLKESVAFEHTLGGYALKLSYILHIFYLLNQKKLSASKRNICIA